jgi:hypothetical protein
MLLAHCNRCDHDFAPADHDVESLHRTSTGGAAYVRCPAGHLVITRVTSRPVATPTT